MKQNNRPVHYASDDEHTFFVGNSTSSTASATECTGLIPSLPTSYDQLLSYQDLYDIPVSSNYPDDTKIYTPHHRTSHEKWNHHFEDDFSSSHWD